MANMPHAVVDLVLRYFYMAAGIVLTCVGIAGVILPLMPGTIFLILAAAAFARSSPRLEAWLLNHPKFGRTLRDWRRDHSISLTIKVYAITTIWISICISAIVAPWEIAVLWCILGVGVTWYLWTRPTRKTGPPEGARE